MTNIPDGGYPHHIYEPEIQPNEILTYVMSPFFIVTFGCPAMY
jgi:hypothetical protein